MFASSEGDVYALFWHYIFPILLTTGVTAALHRQRIAAALKVKGQDLAEDFISANTNATS